ncbi:MotA/TolQ/ExbB proton channel family protein [Ferruginibacter paludis]|jgi:biopolymer transport protein ExbB|uniref:MotA/TolQ/ExbB proton channel family protein n=1 Tax=Ferruginibacter TaxID=1004303 RepID=UPI0025B59F5C|nr:MULTISPECIES: MotA/TolQ/ExbB proton channel family protein [Ferruginibacter]MDB5275485.1 MotA/TolQ/ExbB proton channel family protein [Ferruginibacter sp.]MDN3658837.1 MotA/TolQ/ExbB proton channel family protein [Ferruginibacter paludis]
MFDILLQVDTTKVATELLSQKSENVWGVLAKGGLLMIPLMTLLVVAIFFFIERLLTITKAAKIEDNFMSIIRDNIVSGNVTAARNLAKNTNNPVARVIDKGMQRIGKPIDAIEKSMDNVGVLEMYKLEKNLSIISIIARIAPLFGFLGTIIGMLALFKGIAATSEYTPNTIADGIYIKMITSATGLIIGILAYLGHSFLQAQIARIENKIDAASAEFVDILQEPTR